MKQKILSIALLIILLMSGCSFIGTDIETMLSPPKPTGDQAGIKEALQEAVGRNIILKFPLSGEHRSAFVMHDINNDGEKEVFAFYRLRSEGAGMHVNVLCCNNGKWKSVFDYTSSYNEVDSIHFTDLDGDGTSEILIGWSAYNTKVLSIFSLQNDQLVLRNQYENEEIVDNYTQYRIADFDGDGRDEILFMLLNSSAKTAGARMIALTRERVINKGNPIELNGNVSSWAQIKTGTIFEGRTGILLDGYIEKNQLITELIYWNGANLVAPFSNQQEDQLPETLRESTILSMDIDGDGIIEIPIPTILPGYENSLPEEKKFRADWYTYNGTTLKKEMSGILNTRENYFFKLPAYLENKITIEAHAASRSMVFYLFRENRDGASRLGDPFMRIGVFTQTEWRELSDSLNYQIIATKGDFVYAVEFLSFADEAKINLSTVKSLFTILPAAS